MVEFDWRFPAPDDVASVVGARLGPYRVQEVLGHGAVGIVLRVQDATGRDLALKLLRAPRPSAVLLERFQREGTLTAALRHPGIVTVHDAGLCEEGPFLVYEYVPGQDLGQQLEALDRDARLDVVLGVARALAYAHSRGVVHRDLKPANILLGADGVVRVSDFGLAHHAEELRLTRTGDFIGTPSAMAPEQATGRRDAIAPHTDVWALGVLLYQVLTDREPFAGDTITDLLVQITAVDPASPRTLDQSIPRPLAAVCLKALEKDPARRYPDAGAFADALEAAREGASRRSRALPAAAVLALALLAPLAAWLASGEHRSPPGPGRLPDDAATAPSPEPPGPGRTRAPDLEPDLEPDLASGLVWDLRLGQRVGLLLECATSCRIGTGARASGLGWRILLALEVTEAREDAWVLRGVVERLRITMRFFQSRFDYDGWRRSPNETPFFAQLEGAPVAITIDPRTGRVDEFTGVDAARDERLLPAAKAWILTPAAHEQIGEAILVFNDQMLRNGLGGIQNRDFRIQLDLLLAGLPPGRRHRAEPWSRDASVWPHLAWQLYHPSLTLTPVRPGVYTLEGELPPKPKERVGDYTLAGEAVFRGGAEAAVTIRERYTLQNLDPESTNLNEQFGLMDVTAGVPRLERTLGLRVSPR